MIESQVRFSVGYVQGFMAYSTFDSVTELGNYKNVHG